MLPGDVISWLFGRKYTYSKAHKKLTYKCLISLIKKCPSLPLNLLKTEIVVPAESEGLKFNGNEDIFDTTD
jgi:hypothetical protein